MATRSITDSFVVKAADFYRVVAEAEQDAEKRKSRPAPPMVHVKRMTPDERAKVFAK